MLVATEQLSPAAARAAGYAPERRRWFAKVGSAGCPTAVRSLRIRRCAASQSVSRQSGYAVACLPQEAREALAAFFW